MCACMCCSSEPLLVLYLSCREEWFWESDFDSFQTHLFCLVSRGTHLTGFVTSPLCKPPGLLSVIRSQSTTRTCTEKTLNVCAYMRKRDNVNLFGDFVRNFSIYVQLLSVNLFVSTSHVQILHADIFEHSERIIDELRRENGHISIRDYRSKITSIFLFYGGMGVQYLGPYLLLLCLVLLLFASNRVDYDTTLVNAGTDDEGNSFNIFRFWLECVFFFSAVLREWWSKIIVCYKIIVILKMVHDGNDHVIC